MRRLALLFSLLFCVLAGPSEENQRERLGADPRITATPVQLDSRDPAARRAGALTYLGGVHLRSPDRVFGGFSAMHVSGDRFLLVSDSGNVVRFRLDADFRLSEAQFGDVAAGPGTGYLKKERDVESLAHDPATGRIWLGFERDNAIWRYDATLTRAERSVRPPAMRDWSPNGGAESMVRLRSGRFIVISETSRPKGPLAQTGRIGLMFTGDPTEAPDRGFRFTYIPPPGFDPSDMAELPDGRLLVLNRHFSLRALFTAKLTLVDPRSIRPGAAVQGREIAHFAAPLLHDNFEALAVTQEAGATIVWIASDDNLQFWERSLLLKFRLEL
ncbi:esterase-like activity of phytase family protein [Sphingomonas soli]|uniref:esterase-like activity of phytase family protein n=1 Tax=Sphingomonas soli TaxID=266127 RepID=UPI000835E8A9|nr:esterase-like activity of phytase family protein [Sphingomonas soli]